MAVKIRLRRIGAKKQPAYRIVIADARAPRDGRFIEVIGHYNPLTDPPTIVVNGERALHWLRNGAQPTEVIRKMLVRQGVWAEFTGQSMPEAPVAPVEPAPAAPVEEPAPVAEAEVAAAEPAEEAATEPAEEAPVEPAEEAPVEPAEETPVEPAEEAPAEVTTEVPVEEPAAIPEPVEEPAPDKEAPAE